MQELFCNYFAFLCHNFQSNFGHFFCAAFSPVPVWHSQFAAGPEPVRRARAKRFPGFFSRCGPLWEKPMIDRAVI
jgi:hypothetical protein